MKELDRPKNLKRFYLSWQRLKHVYEEYAKEHDLTYISMFVLQLIDDGTTQKELCDALYFPKQTVNKVILSYEKKGYVTLVENSDDRRARSILLTEKGRVFQKKVISHIEKAELETFASLTEQEQQIMTDLWDKYTSTCISKIKDL
mgnify:FL=1